MKLEVLTSTQSARRLDGKEKAAPQVGRRTHPMKALEGVVRIR
jgi:hypothetical protein